MHRVVSGSRSMLVIASRAAADDEHDVTTLREAALDERLTGMPAVRPGRPVYAVGEQLYAVRLGFLSGYENE